MEARTLLSTLSLSASPTSVGESDPYGVQVAFDRTYPVPPGGPHYATFELSGAARFADPDADYTFSGHDTAYGTRLADGKLHWRIYLTPTGTSALTIKPLYDVRDEPDEPVVVTATDAPGHTINPASASVTILDDDPAPGTVSVTAVEPTASEAGPVRGRLRFTRVVGHFSMPLTVRYRVREPSPAVPGLANGNDYWLPGSATSGTGTDAGYMIRTVTFNGNQGELFVDLSPFADALVEGDETVTAEVLSDPGSLDGGPTSRPAYNAAGSGATVTISDMPVVQSVTWRGVDPGDGATNLEDNNPPEMGGGFRLFPDKNKPEAVDPDAPLHNKAKVVVTLSATVAAGQSVTVYAMLFDVDDPTAQGDPVDPRDAPTAQSPVQYLGGDNRGGGIQPANASVVVLAGHNVASFESTFSSVDFSHFWSRDSRSSRELRRINPNSGSVPRLHVFENTLFSGHFWAAKMAKPHSSLNAGNNFRVFATTDQALFNDVELDPDVENGKSSVNPFRGYNDPTIKPDPKHASPTLTLWRKFHIERDSMAAPPPGEVFDGAGVGNDDVHPGGPSRNPSLNLAHQQFRRAFIEIVDDLAPWDPVDDYGSWKRNTPNWEFGPWLAPPLRNVAGDAEFWAVPVVGVYEFGDFEDYDDTEEAAMGYTPQGRGSFISLETIRDVAANYRHPQSGARAVSVARLEERNVTHELAHHFSGITHDVGIMFAETLVTAQDDSLIAFTPGQLALLRYDANPCDQT